MPSAGMTSPPRPDPSPGMRVIFVLMTGLLLGALPLLSCSAPPKSEQKAELTSDGLELVRKTPRTRLWVKPDHHLGRYDDILIAGIGFQYTQDQDPLDRTEEAQIGEMLSDALTSLTESGPVGKSTTPGPCVVAIQLGLKDIRLHIDDSTGSATSFVSSFGSATMVVEFRDSTSEVAAP